MTIVIFDNYVCKNTKITITFTKQLFRKVALSILRLSNSLQEHLKVVAICRWQLLQ